MSRKTTEPAKQKGVIKFSDCLTLSNFIISQDMMLEHNNALSMLRLYDELTVAKGQTPPFFPPIKVCLEFWKNRNISNEDLDELQLAFKVVLRNPEKKETEICSAEVTKAGKWLFARTILDLSGHLGFAGFGEYTFLVYGKTKESEYSELIARPMPVVEHQGDE